MPIENLCTFRLFNIPYSDGAVRGSGNEDVVQVLKSPNASVVAMKSMEKTASARFVDVDSRVIRPGDDTIRIELETSHDVSSMPLKRDVSRSHIWIHPVAADDKVLPIQILVGGKFRQDIFWGKFRGW
jgi:hypothetical protein